MAVTYFTDGYPQFWHTTDMTKKEYNQTIYQQLLYDEHRAMFGVR